MIVLCIAVCFVRCVFGFVVWSFGAVLFCLFYHTLCDTRGNQGTRPDTTRQDITIYHVRSGDTRGPQGTPWDTCQGIPRETKQHQRTTRDTRRHQGMPGDTRGHHGTPGNTAGHYRTLQDTTGHHRCTAGSSRRSSRNSRRSSTHLSEHDFPVGSLAR